MIEELTKLMPEKNMIITDLATLVIRGVSKSSFADWIMAEPKPIDFTPLVFNMFHRNSDFVKQAIVSLTHGLILGSLLADKLFEDFSRDMNVVIQKVEGIFHVLESKQKIGKSAALISTPNASALVPQSR